MPDAPQHKTTVGPPRSQASKVGAGGDLGKGLLDLIGNGLENLAFGIAAQTNPQGLKLLLAQQQQQGGAQAFIESLVVPPAAIPDAPPTSRGLGAGGQPFDFSQDVLGIQAPSIPTSAPLSVPELPGPVSAPASAAEFQERVPSGQARKPPPRPAPISKAQQLSETLPPGASLNLKGPGGATFTVTGQQPPSSPTEALTRIAAENNASTEELLELTSSIAAANRGDPQSINGLITQRLLEKDAPLEEILAVQRAGMRAGATQIINRIPPSKQLDDAAQIGTMIGLLDGIDSKYNPNFVNVLRGNIPSAVLDVVGKGSDQERALRADTSNLKDLVARLRTGAVISDADEVIFARFLPDVTQHPLTFESNKATFRAFTEAVLKRQVAIINSVQTGKELTVEDLTLQIPLTVPKKVSQEKYLELINTGMTTDEIAAQGIAVAD